MNGINLRRTGTISAYECFNLKPLLKRNVLTLIKLSTWYQVRSDHTCNYTPPYFWRVRPRPCASECESMRTLSGSPLDWANQRRLRLWTRLTKIDNLNVSTFCAFNSNTNADGWASHRASFRCFGNALADEPSHLPIGGLTSVSFHSQIYHRSALHINAQCIANHWDTFIQANPYSWLWK